MTPTEIAALVARLSAAAAAYHNGAAELLMTDDEYDAALERLRAAAPTHPFLKQVGAPVATGDEVPLPIPLPSLNKIKPADGSLEKWLARNPSTNYHISLKLDGCSALWLPATRRLYTRGDGMRGRDVSAFAPFFQGLPAAGPGSGSGPSAVRGELIMRTDSPAIPTDKLARNIVAGALNRKEPDPALFAEIRFVAYELLEPATLTPTEAFRQLRLAGYEVARSTALTPDKMTPTGLSELFSLVESKSPYQIDGIVVAPNVARLAAPVAVRKGEALNPPDRVAWKTRAAGAAATATTTVRTVEWNPSASGYLIPRVLFDTVALSGANIGAATGLHARWITDNAVGPGAVIEVRRAGDVIPQIIAVRSPAPGGPAMPPAGSWEWVGGDSVTATAVHIRVAATTSETACVRLTRALAELGAENVGPGLVAKLYAAGYHTIGAIYAASVDDLAAKVEGVKARGAVRLWEGLRAGRAGWTELTLLVASCCMPRGIGHTRLTPLLAINPTPATWTVSELTAAAPAGLTAKTIESIVAAVPAYMAWRAENFGTLVFGAAPAPAPSPAPTPVGPKATVVLTSFRDRTLETALQAAGHTVADAVSRKTTHLVYPDGPEPTSTKITKARELGTGIQILPVGAFRAAFGL